MSALSVNSEMSFPELKELLGVTDGNLASHIKALESEQYVIVNKEFQNRKPRTCYAITKSGKKAFSDHIEALESIINHKK